MIKCSYISLVKIRKIQCVDLCLSEKSLQARIHCTIVTASLMITALIELKSKKILLSLPNLTLELSWIPKPSIICMDSEVDRINIFSNNLVI